MGRLPWIILGALAALAAWAVLVAFGAREGWLRPMPAAPGDTAGFVRWAEGQYTAQSRGNFAIVLLDDGQVAQTHFASHGRAIDGDSLFQVASVSKWLTAWGVMTLVEQGRIDLDAPASRYLTRWQLPASAFDDDQVTVRRLLSHTAGLTDGLGFMGYEPGEAVLSIEQELAQPMDVYPSASGVVAVGSRPGDTWRYSGGGYLILQLIIEEVTQESFNDYMRRAVFAPLGMNASTFVDPDPAYLAEIYGPDGAPALHYTFTATGAASLYTTADDLTRFVQAQVGGPNAGGGVLRPQTVETMRTPQAYLLGLPVWGLGEALYAPDGAGGFISGHDGSNYPAISTTVRVNPATGDALIVLSTGQATLAHEIGGAWAHWQSGIVGLDALAVFDLRWILIVFGTGAVVIIGGAIWFAWAGRRQRA